MASSCWQEISTGHLRESLLFTIFLFCSCVSYLPPYPLPSFLLPLFSFFILLYDTRNLYNLPHLSFCVSSCECFHSPFFLLSPLPRPLFSFLRLSPIWEVSEHALRAIASSRLCSLAQPRAPVAGWRPDRLPLAPVSKACLISWETAFYLQIMGQLASFRLCQNNCAGKGKVAASSNVKD